MVEGQPMTRLFGSQDKITDGSEVMTLLRDQFSGVAGASHKPVSLAASVDDIFDISPTQLLSSPAAAGDVIFTDATPKLALLNIGTAKQVLAVNSGGTLPEWATLDTSYFSDVAYAAPGLTLGTSNVEGVANTVIRTDATILAFDATNPTTIAAGATAGPGAATVAARRDHTHGVTTTSDASATPSTILQGDASGYLHLARLYVDDYIYHDQDTSDFIRFVGSNIIQIAAGGVECIRVFSNTMVFNENAVDYDYRFESLTNTNALFIRGSDGVITFGAYGAGVIKSDAGGILSSGQVDVSDVSDLAYATPALTLGTANAAGAANTVIRTDATILAFDATNPVAIDAGNVAAPGAASVAARRDHTHAVTATFDASATPGELLKADSNGYLWLARLYVDDYIVHDGDGDTYLFFETDKMTFRAGNIELLALIEAAQDEVSINDGGVDVDFRVEGVGEANALLVQGSDGLVGIGLGTPGARLDLHESTALGGTAGNSQVITKISGLASANSVVNDLFLYRDVNGADWTTARIHDSISVDSSFKTPGTDTKTWWERDPNDNIQSWGNAATTYMTINAGNVGIGIVSPSARLHVDQDNTIAASPVLYLDQADVSEEMIEFNTTIGTGNAIEAIGGKSLTTTHFIKVTIPGGLTRYIPIGTIA
jgi:hypothetical protein